MTPPAPPRTVRRHERGFAAAAALLAIALTGTIAAAVVELARVEVVLAGRRRAMLDALAAVDACAEEATSALPAGWEFDAVLRGADDMPGTADDGLVPLPAGCTGMARPAPGPALPPRAVFELEASRGAGRRRLDAVVGRRPTPGAPALLWATSSATLGPVTGSLTLDGVDPANPLAAWAAAAAPDEPVLLDGWMAAAGAALDVRAGTASPIWSPPPPVGDLAVRAAAAGAVPPATGLVGTSPPPPAVMLAPGDLTIAAPLFGAGVLVVRGALRIEAPLEFTGAIAAGGGVRIGTAGALTLRGGLWLGGDSMQALAVDGTATILASTAALADADALLPLPRLPRIAAVRDF